MPGSPRTGTTAVDWPESVSKAVTASVVAGYGVALAGFAIVLIGNDLSLGRALLHGLVVLALLTAPPTTALLSQPTRPLMLLPAGLMGLFGISGALSILGLPLVALGLIWIWGYAKLTSPGRWVKKVAMIFLPVLWLGATTALWIHVDPVCEQRLRDGSIIQVDPFVRGFDSGWTWEVSSSSISSSTISGDVVSETCTSNAVVAWEGLSAIGLCAGVVVLARFLSPPSTVPRTQV
jgi:hypothetical protein